MPCLLSSPAMAQPLSTHPIFQLLASDVSSSPSSLPCNLIAYDGCGRLFVWNPSQQLLHSVDIDLSDPLLPSQGTLLAKTRFRTLQPDSDVDFAVRYLALNRRGWSAVLAGDAALVGLDLTFHFPDSPATAETSPCKARCRATRVGGDKFQSSNKALRILQVAWHPYSDTHLGVLSSDGVFRLFDLSINAENPEQEYHLQCGPIDRSTPTNFSRPVAFAFGGEHLWDRFAVFILFSNGFIYTLCPISPFGSLYNIAAIEELYRDACQWASSGADSKVVSNANRAAAWLEAIFPMLISGTPNYLVLKARAHVPFNASLLLQGPLPIITGGNISSTISNRSSPASMLVYSTVGKDSILAISLRDGQMQLYALADELQPVWNDGISPRVQVNSEGNLVSIGMLVETYGEFSASDQVFGKNDGSMLNQDGVWTGQSPPLLQLAVIDFALPGSVLESAPLSILADPVVPERLYCHHAAGIDAILLQWLPFSEQFIDRASSGKPPTVYPILDTCPGGKLVHLPLVGVAEILDSFGEMWLVAVTASCECAVIGMKSHRALDPLYIQGNKGINQETENAGVGVLQVISKDLLQGPKPIPIPQISSSGQPLTLDSIEGRTILHDQYKLLHEKYIEYAHRVHVELTSHGVRLHKVVQEQQTRLREAQNKLGEALQLSESLTSRIKAAFQNDKILKDRVRRQSALLGVKQKPLTAAEQEYRSHLDAMQRQDLGVLHSAVDVLKERFERHLHLSKALNQQQVHHRIPSHERVAAPDAQMNRLKVTVNQLALLVEGALKQVRIIEDVVKERELLSNH